MPALILLVVAMGAGVLMLGRVDGLQAECPHCRRRTGMRTDGSWIRPVLRCRQCGGEWRPAAAPAVAATLGVHDCPEEGDDAASRPFAGR